MQGMNQFFTKALMCAYFVPSVRFTKNVLSLSLSLSLSPSIYKNLQKYLATIQFVVLAYLFLCVFIKIQPENTGNMYTILKNTTFPEQKGF